MSSKWGKAILTLHIKLWSLSRLPSPRNKISVLRLRVLRKCTIYSGADLPVYQMFANSTKETRTEDTTIVLKILMADVRSEYYLQF